MNALFRLLCPHLAALWCLSILPSAVAQPCPAPPLPSRSTSIAYWLANPQVVNGLPNREQYLRISLSTSDLQLFRIDRNAVTPVNVPSIFPGTISSVSPSTNFSHVFVTGGGVVRLPNDAGPPVQLGLTFSPSANGFHVVRLRDRTLFLTNNGVFLDDGSRQTPWLLFQHRSGTKYYPMSDDPTLPFALIGIRTQNASTFPVYATDGTPDTLVNTGVLVDASTPLATRFADSLVFQGIGLGRSAPDLWITRSLSDTQPIPQPPGYAFDTFNAVLHNRLWFSSIFQTLPNTQTATWDVVYDPATGQLTRFTTTGRLLSATWSRALPSGALVLAGEYEPSRTLWFADPASATHTRLAIFNHIPYEFARFSAETSTHVVFLAADAASTDQRPALWTSDGTLAGTRPLLSAERLENISSDQFFLVSVGGLAYFPARDSQTGVELWSTDGTPAGTRRVLDAVPGSLSPYILPPFRSNNQTIFAAVTPGPNLSVFQTDGSPEGTSRLTSSPISTRVSALRLTPNGQTVTAFGHSDALRFPLIRWNGRSESPEALADLTIPFLNFYAFYAARIDDGRTFLPTGTNSIIEVSSDGLSQRTINLPDPGSIIRTATLLAVNNRVLFNDLSDSASRPLLVLDPNTNSARPLSAPGVDLAYSVSLGPLALLNSNGIIYVTDGTPEATKPLPARWASYSSVPAAMFNARVVFAAFNTDLATPGIFSTQGITDSTVFIPTDSSTPLQLLGPTLRGVAFTNTAGALFVSDGANITRLLPNASIGFDPALVSVGTKLFITSTFEYRGNSPRPTLTVTDGTPAGTSSFLISGVGRPYPAIAAVASFNDSAIISVDDASGVTFLRSAGKPELTCQIASFPTTTLNSKPLLTNSRLFFTLSSPSRGSLLASINLCPPDHNNSASINSQDIFDFLTDFFAAAPPADINNSGAVNPQDLFDFLSAWFVGCP